MSFVSACHCCSFTAHPSTVSLKQCLWQGHIPLPFAGRGFYAHVATFYLTLLHSQSTGISVQSSLPYWLNIYISDRLWHWRVWFQCVRLLKLCSCAHMPLADNLCITHLLFSILSLSFIQSFYYLLSLIFSHMKGFYVESILEIIALPALDFWSQYWYCYLEVLKIYKKLYIGG